MRRFRNLANERWFLGLILLIGLLAVACGDGATPTSIVAPPTATAAPTPTVAATAAPTEEVMTPKVATLEAVQNPGLGVTMLVDGGWLTVYLLTKDELGSSSCSGPCVDFWPPLLTVGDPTPGDGVSADQLGTIERDDCSSQVTYNGWPLYYFAFDNGPGETNGQGSGDVWYAVSPTGNLVDV
jgi:predicted lipoprotein with Yx(FWY)xxD motif